MSNKPKIISFFRSAIFYGLTFCFLISQGQDVHFSQSLAAMQQRNPAFSNNYEGEFQVLSVYREQWGSIGVPFQSSLIAANAQVYEANSSLSFFAGLLYLNDQSGDAELNVNQVGLNLGAKYKMGLNEFIASISNSLVSKEFNGNLLTFPDQYDRNIGGFNEKLGSGENFNNQKLNTYNLGLGLAWKRILSKRWIINSGLSFLNLTRANESFLEETAPKKISWGIQSEAEYRIKDNLILLPYVNYFRSDAASETVFGSGLKVQTNESNNIAFLQPFVFSRAGFNRNLDALIIGSYIGLKKFVIGASYDFNISNLQVASNYNGAFEISLTYVAKNKQVDKRAIPCDRF